MEPIWRPHLEHLKALGINTIRLYAVDPTAPHDKFMCELSKLGIYAFVGMAAICEGCYVLDTEAPKCYTDAMFTRAMKIYNAFAVVLIANKGFSVGNENNLGTQIEKSAPCVKALIRDVRTYADKCNGSLRPVPIGLDNADIDTTLHPRASWLGYYDCLKDGNENTRAEWIGFNPYVECDTTIHVTYEDSKGLQKLVSDYKQSKYSRPIVLGEFGCIKVVNTVSGIEQQRNFYDAKWMNEAPDMTEYVVGGIAFEYSVEKANLIDKSATPPFAAADPGRYGIGYFTPDNCDHEGVPCKYNKYPEFTFLADAFKTTKPSTINSKSFVPTRTTTMTCPANFPTVALPPTPKGKDSDAKISLMRMRGRGVVPILECSVYQPKCNGGLANKQQRYTPDNSTTGAAKLPFGAVAPTTLAPNAATTNGSGTAVASAALLVLVGMLAMTI
ncbi:hypothetical protein DYB38_003501 [Aphanomyces astaci]|uniref:1,3-beta-glucanosyltransferase n=1 Tax=Aphanomyces astaci TaxID=112090 RepID=A0A397D3C2_APHAT|nr:hypothetical protein DYB38_003501 [Aphanomyces astaci]